MTDDIAIRVSGLSKSFGAQKVLDGIDIDVRRGEIFAVMGLSGSGKSVLVKHFVGLHSIDEGDILIEGASLKDMDSRERLAYLQRIGMVFQHAALFDSLTTGENVAFPLRERGEKDEAKITARVTEMLTAVGLEEAADKMPAELSGGMQKRAGIARGLVGSPDFLFFDEPTTGLDPITSVLIENLIMETHARFGYTGVVITHSVTTAQRIANRLALLWKGRIRALGTPDEIMASPDPVVQGFLRQDPSVLDAD
jgi:phospholipid/cholesterol/gamma-HCH transport system ATP-binding protein